MATWADLLPWLSALGSKPDNLPNYTAPGLLALDGQGYPQRPQVPPQIPAPYSPPMGVGQAPGESPLGSPQMMPQTMPQAPQAPTPMGDWLRRSGQRIGGDLNAVGDFFTKPLVNVPREYTPGGALGDLYSRAQNMFQPQALAPPRGLPSPAELVGNIPRETFASMASRAFPSGPPSAIGTAAEGANLAARPEPSPYQDSAPTHFAYRINNPGNITAENPKSLTAYPGVVGTYAPGNGRTYLKFDSMESGMAAIGQTLASYGPGTVKELITKYAGSYNPNYVKTVETALGVEPGAKVNFRDADTVRKAVPAIVKFETGQSPPGAPVTQLASTAPVPRAAPPTAPEPGPLARNPAPAASPVAAPAAAATPSRFGPDASLWPMLIAAGSGMTQPNWYGARGAIGQGLANAGQVAMTHPETMLKRELLKAQVGKTQAEADIRSRAMALASDKSVPAAVRGFFAFGLFEKGMEEWAKRDPEGWQAEAAKRGLVANATKAAELQAEYQPSAIQGKAAQEAAVAAEKEKVKSPEQWQAQAAAYANRMNNSNQTLTRLGASGYTSPSLATWLATDKSFESFQGTKEDQSFIQSAREWISAKLRKESGAVINKDEFRRDFQTYFPMPGDDAATIQQKADSRLRIEAEMKAQAGNAYAKMFPGTTTPRTASPPKPPPGFAVLGR